MQKGNTIPRSLLSASRNNYPHPTFLQVAHTLTAGRNRGIEPWREDLKISPGSRLTAWPPEVTRKRCGWKIRALTFPPPAAAIAATQSVRGRDEVNSYLPFTGSIALREAAARHLHEQTGRGYSADEVVSALKFILLILRILLILSTPMQSPSQRAPSRMSIVSWSSRS